MAWTVRNAMRWAAGLAVGSMLGGCAHDRSHTQMADSRIGTSLPPLVTGKLLEDRLAEASADVGSLPMNLIATPDGQFVLSSDMGAREDVCVVRTSDGKETGRLDFPAGPPKSATRGYGLYYGLAVGPEGAVYAAQGGHEKIAVLKLGADGSLTRSDVIDMTKGDFPAGLALDSRGMLYVANNDPGAGAIFGTPASVAIYDTKTKKEVGRFSFSESFAGTSNFPLSVAVLTDGSKCYVASQRDSCVYVFDTKDAEHPKLSGKIASGSHPAGLLFNKDQSKLFIANAHSDTISVVTTADDSIAATILLRPEIARNLPGATPLGMGLSPDEKMLYAALGDMNAVAIVDLAKAELKGYVPAGWYPTGVVAAADGKRILVTNAKGNKTRLPNMSVTNNKKSKGNASPLTLFEGNVATLPVPTGAGLAEQTQRVLELNKLTPRYVKAENPLKDIGLAAGKITHVIYIVKENRTYDQVLGDVVAGNGDADLCIFGKEVTPNLHALASRFVLLDNFYDCGEVSGDGWVWSTQAHANEYTIKNVPYQYSHRGRIFDYEGSVQEYPTGGFPAVGPDGKPMSEDPIFVEGAKAVPDVAEAPGGHIWDAAIKAKLTYRNYGFFISNGLKRQGKLSIPDNYPAVAALQPGGHDLAGVTDVDYRKFDLDYADSEAPHRFAAEGNDKKFLRPRAAYGKADAPSRFTEWNREFQMMLAKDPTGAAVPTFMTVRMGDDHTVGANPDKHTPRSMVADNDYGVGQLVDAVSHSPIWKSTAIVVIEDDAQNGPDHVDAHRSTCYVISPWIKPRSVDHSFQNTVSALKTIECLLGLPPMSQYDAVATPIMNWDTAPNNAEPYEAIAPSKALMAELNAGTNPVKPVSPELKSMIEQSKAMDFTVADRAPADVLNQIIWQTVKGPGAVMPASPHGPVLAVQPGKKVKDDDDD